MAWLAGAVAVGVLGWIDPVLVVLLGLVVGIVWLRRSDAHPVHWGPVPRGGRCVRSSGPVAGLHGAAPSEGSASGEIEDARRRTVLPLARTGAGVTAVRGGSREEVSAVAHEAGVRKQL